MILLDDYLNMIRKESWKCKERLFRSSVWDIEDLVQEGIKVFYDCLETYDESKSSFSTWLYLNLRSAYSEIVRKENKLDNPVENIVVDFRDEIKNIIAFESLSQSAKDLVCAIFSMPEPLKEIIDQADLVKESIGYKRKIGLTKKILCQYFGMSWRKIKKIEKEIRLVYEF